MAVSIGIRQYIKKFHQNKGWYDKTTSLQTNLHVADTGFDRQFWKTKKKPKQGKSLFLFLIEVRTLRIYK